MIYFAICILSVIIAIALSVVSVIFKPASSRFVTGIIVSWTLAIALTCSYVVAHAAAIEHGKHLQQTYDELMIYYNIASTTTDETVRFDYYTKVKDYNESYQYYADSVNNIWYSSLYNAKTIENITPIDFILNVG